MIFSLLIAVAMIASIWKVFTKAGEPGWAAIIPIYNILVLLKIAGKPAWWIILYLIPFVNFIISILVMISLANKFGKGAGFGLGLAFLPFIFYPMLGFGSSAYNANA
ncbi:MAG: signal peptidase I [Polyangiaceae bacterium]|nr:signal peptidase I [Polyangiaceae bacterium]